jgi:two-component system, OmpR family, sensor kinase
VGQYGWRGSRAIARRLARPSLQARLVAAVMGLVAAAAVAITAAGYLTVRDYLVRQAGQQLRAYASDLTSHSFAMFPGAPVASAASGPGGPNGPGGAVSVEVRDPEGQLIISAGPAPRAVGGGNWLMIAEPVHYQVRHILFVFGADNYSVVVTAQARSGQAGRLVVRLSLASVTRAADQLAAICLAVSGVVLLLVGCGAAVAIRAILRPFTRVERTAAAAAAGELSCRIPVRQIQGSGGGGRLARSLNQFLGQAERTLRATAASEASARASTERMGRIIADTAGQLRRPVNVLYGTADYYLKRERLGPGEPEHVMRKVADEAARIDALIDDLARPDAAHDF